MYIKEFLKNLTIGVRKREIVFWSMPLCSLAYGIMPEQSLIYLNTIIIVIFILASTMLGFSSIQFLRNIFSIKKPHPVKIPELQELANKMGLKLSAQPFWEIDKKIAAKSNKHTKKITFGKDYLKSLTSEEKKFVGGHEFFHLYGAESIYFLIIFGPIISFLGYIQFIQNIPVIVFLMGFIGAVIGAGCFFSRSTESIADIYGAVNVNKESAVSALEKAHVGKRDKKFYSHPDINSRIKNLNRYYQKQK